MKELIRQPVSRLKARFLDGQEPAPRSLLEALEADSRRGARDLAARLRERASANRAEGQRLRRLLKYESELWAQGFNLIAGVDEAGVGPLAGPVVAGAVVLSRRYKLRELDDSKEIDEATRERLAAANQGGRDRMGDRCRRSRRDQCFEYLSCRLACHASSGRQPEDRAGLHLSRRPYDSRLQSAATRNRSRRFSLRQYRSRFDHRENDA